MKIPSKTDCYRIICRSGMLDNIFIHSLQVSRVARFLADAMIRSEMVINRDIVEAAALLHDITKTKSLSTGEAHDLTGACLLDSMGYGEIANIVRQHVRLDIKPSPPFVMEGKIVHYADKRVLHDRVVTLKERHRDILARYGTDPYRRTCINENFSATKILEQLIFNTLPFTPVDIEGLMPSADFDTEQRIFESIKTGHRSREEREAILPT